MNGLKPEEEIEPKHNIRRDKLKRPNINARLFDGAANKTKFWRILTRENTAEKENAAAIINIK